MRVLLNVLGSALLLLAFSQAGRTQSGPPPAAQEIVNLLQRSQTLAEENRLVEAEATLEDAAAQRGADLRVLTLLAEVKSRLGEHTAAVKLFRQVSTSQPGSAQAHLNLAIALADDGQPQEALQQLNQAARLNPQSSQVHLNRARVLADLHQVLQARAEFSRAALLAPADPTVNYFWGVFESENHRPVAAASLLTRVTVAQPDNVRAFVSLGQAEQLAGHNQQAIVAWRKALDLNPDMQETVYSLAQVLRATDPNQSAQLMQQFETLHAVSQKLEQVRELGNQAYAAMQHEEWDSAVTVLHHAIEICNACSLQADLHQRLGLAECHRGHLETGERELRLAQSLNPNDRETLQALQWVALQKK